MAFYAPTFAGTLFVTRQGELVYALPASTAGGRRGKREALSSAGWALSEQLAGGRVRPAGQDPSATGVSYFLGNDPARWRSRVTTYDQVGLGEVWPGARSRWPTSSRGTSTASRWAPTTGRNRGQDAFVTRLTYSLAAVDGLGLSALVNQPTFTTGQTLKLSGVTSVSYAFP